MSHAPDPLVRREILAIMRWLARDSFVPEAPMALRYRTPALLTAAEYGAFFRADWQERGRIVASVRRLRAAAADTLGVPRYALLNTQAHEVRLLAFDPEQSLSDGAAMVATDGLFNYDNIPPWDLWITCGITDNASDGTPWRPFASQLICWIPDALVALVAAGLDVNPEKCLDWLS